MTIFQTFKSCHVSVFIWKLYIYTGSFKISILLSMRGWKSYENSKFNKIGELGVKDEWYSDIRLSIKITIFLCWSCQLEIGVLEKINLHFKPRNCSSSPDTKSVFTQGRICVSQLSLQLTNHTEQLPCHNYSLHDQHKLSNILVRSPDRSPQ